MTIQAARHPTAAAHADAVLVDTVRERPMRRARVSVLETQCLVLSQELPALLAHDDPLAARQLQLLALLQARKLLLELPAIVARVRLRVEGRDRQVQPRLAERQVERGLV